MGEKRKRIGFELRLGGGQFSAGMIFGMFLVVAGTLMFVDNLDILPFRAVSLIWPVALIAYGVITGSHTTSMAVRVWSGAAVVAGVMLLLREFDLVRIRGNIFWPLALIATGVVLLIYRLRWRDFEERMSSGTASRSSEHELHEMAVFSEVKRRVVSAAFEGGDLAATFGGIKIDLRRAEISNEAHRAFLEASALFGGIEIRVPEHWHVAIEGNALFGQYEDKTIPPRPEPGVAMPVLVVRGGVAFGAVVLMN